MEKYEVTGAIVVIADEVLSGRTLDRNVQQLALWLADEGIELRFACVVPDDHAAIVAAVRQCVGLYDHVFTSGGIGPTHDDITIAAIGAALHRPLERNAQVEALVRAHYGERVTPARLNFADLPQGTEYLSSDGGNAGALRVGNVYILAGVPDMAATTLLSLRGRLGGGGPIGSRTVGTRLAEEDFAVDLAAVQAQYTGCRIASYPLWRTATGGANIVLRARDSKLLDDCAAAVRSIIRSLGDEPTEGGFARELAARIGKADIADGMLAYLISPR